MSESLPHLLLSGPAGSVLGAFAPDPLQKGRWLKVHLCVIFARCPHCKSNPGVPCKFDSGYGCSCHVVRRQEYWRWKKQKFGWQKGGHPAGTRVVPIAFGVLA